MKNTRILGQHYRNSTLNLLGRLGYGSNRQIARAIWGKLTASTRKMASRTVAGLLNEGYLVARRDRHSINGEQFVALTKAGAALTEFFLPQGRHHARDWLRHAHSHRTAANSVFVAGNSFYPGSIEGGCTELEIRALDEVPAHLAKYEFTIDGQTARKIPDCVIRTDSGHIWVEVENNWRNDKDLSKLVHFIRSLFYIENPPIFQIWLVITAPGAKTIGNRLRMRLSHDHPLDGTPRQIRELDARLLAEKIKIFTLDFDTLVLKSEPYSE